MTISIKKLLREIQTTNDDHDGLFTPLPCICMHNHQGKVMQVTADNKKYNLMVGITFIYEQNTSKMHKSTSQLPAS